MGYSIAIIDDSPLIREAIKTALKNARLPIINIYEGADGNEGLEIIKNNWIDLVISDLHMPNMSGLELIEKAKEEDSSKNIPFIVISSERSHKIKLQLIELGVGFIKKPFKPHEIKDIIISTIGAWNYVDNTREESTFTESDFTAEF